ncbi:hypothetical protein C4571_03520 [Candidatus Parcubacteria bacterium]|nr:MAG: hypothetical protein C4571_03520 [Candidatus Parcubacteria bacterium]
MESLIVGLLQATFVFLSTIQANASLPDGALDRAVNYGSQVVQFSTWVLETNPPAARTVPVVTAPRISDVLGARYLKSGNRVFIGPYEGGKLELLQGYTSFGDLNYDNLDDAMTVIRDRKTDGKESYHLAAVLNFGGDFFNIATLDLGEKLEMWSHDVTYGRFTAEMKIENGEKKTHAYKLVGKRLMSL